MGGRINFLSPAEWPLRLLEKGIQMENEQDIQHLCRICHLPCREYLSGWQHVYRALSSGHEPEGIYESVVPALFPA